MTTTPLLPDLCRTIADPYLNLFRGIIPPIGGTLDLSPILAFVTLSVSWLAHYDARSSGLEPPGGQLPRQEQALNKCGRSQHLRAGQAVAASVGTLSQSDLSKSGSPHPCHL